MSLAENAAPRGAHRSPNPSLPKCPSGIQGLDEITAGGFPLGRPTLVTGGAGCGKTLLATEFLVAGAVQYGDPGVFVSFEERPEELAKNVRSLGFDLDDLRARGLLAIDHVKVDRSTIEETGDYDLQALFIRLAYAIDSVGAKRVALDTIESLFSGLDNHAILRAELRRLFGWLKDKGVTAVITCERGSGTLTRHGLEEYVSDCVILLDHRVEEQVSTRRLRVVKYRGSAHGADEYPFLIGERGINVLPVTSLGLQHDVSQERISTGIPQLDAMLGGKGFYRGSTVLLTGTAGTGKTSVAASFAQACAERGERCLYLAFEESPKQLARNMGSIGLDLRRYQDDGLLRIVASRPTAYGLETHLATIHQEVLEFQPHAVVLDPISNLSVAGTKATAGAMLLRVLDFLKSRGITTLFTSLTSGSGALEESEMGVSSLVDTWLLLRDIELNGERNRGMYVLKSRGMAHSNQIREFVLTNHGIELIDVYVGDEGLLTGSSRVAQEARAQAAVRSRRHELELRRRELERKRRLMEAKRAALLAEFESDTEELERLLSDWDREEAERGVAHAALARSRKSDAAGLPAGNGEAR